jgi:hypothetical protein
MQKVKTISISYALQSSRKAKFLPIGLLRPIILPPFRISAGQGEVTIRKATKCNTKRNEQQRAHR